MALKLSKLFAKGGTTAADVDFEGATVNGNNIIVEVKGHKKSLRIPRKVALEIEELANDKELDEIELVVGGSDNRTLFLADGGGFNWDAID